MKTILIALSAISICFATCSKKLQKSATTDQAQITETRKSSAAPSGKPDAKPTLEKPNSGHSAKNPSTAKKGNAMANNNVAIHFPEEVHLKNVQQLTFGGENAEAYFSFDNKSLVLQKTDKENGIECDRIYVGEIPAMGEKFQMKQVSNGKGRTTCSYFFKGDEKIIYASTHDHNVDCPPVPDRKVVKKYVWPIYDTYELYTANADGSNPKRLTNNNFYDAEATVSPDGKKIVYTSNKSGDLELYVMDIDGSNEIQVTSGMGYDGGAFFSPDSKQLVFRASRPESQSEMLEYKELFAQNMVAPTKMEIYVCDIDGSNLKKITNLGNANWAPFFHPSGEKIIFASNHQSDRGFPFNIYMINMDGNGLKKITHSDTFDAFPMFSPDGKKLVFASNRNNGGTRDTNVFIADWVE